MRLLTGPAGSGKSRIILDEFRAALRHGDSAIRLLTPTATLAQHLQNQVAREGFVFRRTLIQTLSGFVRDLTPEVREAPDAVLLLIVEDAVRRAGRPEFAGVADMPGFCATLKRVIGEFASAGCDSKRLADALPAAPLADGFLAVYREVDRELARRGLVMRARRLEIAAGRIAGSPVERAWLDGFHALPDPELAFISALGRRAEVTLALADEDLTEALRSRLESMGFVEERASRGKTRPVQAVFTAPSIEREVEEIARRILEQAHAGRPFREMGIIVRAAGVYVPLLRTTLARFAIPARFLFDADLAHHPAVRFLTGAVDAMLTGWDFERTLAVLRLSPGLADSAAMDRWDFKVREQMPGNGLGALRAPLLAEDGKARPGSESLLRRLDALTSLEELRAGERTPANWALQISSRTTLFRPARPSDAASHAMALEWRSQSAAIDAFREALDEAALALDPMRAIPLDRYWRAVKAVLRLKPLRLRDGRRDVVHVLSAHEARQWVLPVVFVPGMVEKQFPRFQQQDPFFGDPARCRLHADGIRVRTASEFDREERALFDSAVTRATLLVTLSYPEFDARGERNLRSLFLEGAAPEKAGMRAVRPPARMEPAAFTVLGEIRESSLTAWIRENSPHFSPTGLERYLQCAFQYYATRTLRLHQAPLRPAERLDFLTQGEIVHEVLKEWWIPRGDIAEVFERVFARIAAAKRIPRGYHTERNRNRMLDDLLHFSREDTWPRALFTSETEIGFEFPLAEGVTLRGRIDRIDTAPDGQAFVIDYKYSAGKNVKDKIADPNLMQPALYLLAAQSAKQSQAAGMFYIGLKRGLVYPGWSAAPFLDAAPMPENWLEDTRRKTLAVVEEIRSGRATVAPSDPEKCRFCDAKDVCRVDVDAAIVLEETEGA